jgi:hypothetical protein
MGCIKADRPLRNYCPENEQPIRNGRSREPVEFRVGQDISELGLQVNEPSGYQVYLSNHSRGNNDCDSVEWSEKGRGRPMRTSMGGDSKKEVLTTCSSEYHDSQYGSMRTRVEDGCRAMSNDSVVGQKASQRKEGVSYNFSKKDKKKGNLY